MDSGKWTRVKSSRERRRMSMKFPVAPESMSAVVSMVFFFPCSEMGKLRSIVGECYKYMIDRMGRRH